jgi:DNA adenine methylase
MLEVDRDVAAFWHAALGHGQALAAKVLQFELTRAAVNELTSQAPKDVIEHGFRTLVLNRTRRGGVLAPGAAFTKVGENGKGLGSRWYPETIAKRLQAITQCSGRIGFLEGDAMTFLEGLLHQQAGVAVFLDPPYTAGGKNAGKRLYAHHEIDHAGLFELMADSKAEFLMTYDESPEIVALIRKYGFHAVRVMMKNGHHNQIAELVVTPHAVFA